MTNAFMQIEDIPGSSKEENHEDWIQIALCSQMIQQPINASQNGRRASGHANWGDFVVTKEQDKSSPLLAHACASGKPLPKVTVDLLGAMGDKKNTFMRVTLEDVFLASYTFSGGGGEPRPSEEVRLSYGRIKWEFTPDYQGKPEAPVVKGFDRDKNADAS